MSRQIPTYHLGPDFADRLRAYVDRFLADGFKYFAEEFAQIDSYVAMAKQHDAGEKLRRTEKAEYLLELVAFKIYDDRDREAFDKAKNTLIVMPDCLSLHNPDCQKVETPYGDECQSCVPHCQACQICELADRYMVKTIFSKRKLTKQLQHYREQLGDLGVIGVACIKMLASGMRSAAEADVPARGVLLNFSGCEHWNDQPCASEFSMAWLEAILEEKHGRQNKKADH